MNLNILKTTKEIESLYCHKSMSNTKQLKCCPTICTAWVEVTIYECTY